LEAFSLTDADLARAERNLHLFDPEQKIRLLALLEERDKRRKVLEAQERFLPFVERVWPEFIRGAHHVLMAEAFEKVARGEINRLIIDMPPRFTKSQFASWLLPAWFLGKFPNKKIIQASNTEALASGFGRQVRNLVSREAKQTGETKLTDPYHEIFPNVDLSKDSQAAGHWHTNYNGIYFAVGVNGRVTGIGGDIILIDDPHSEQEAKQAESRPEIFDDVTEWFTSGPRQRLQPGGSIIIVATRWSKRDLVGQVLKKMEQDIKDGRRKGTYDHWEVITLPAILDEGEETERSMWPGFWPLEALQATRNALPVSKWQAQYQQSPVSEEGALIKREYWRKWGVNRQVDTDAGKSSCPGPQHMKAWENLDPPACEYVIMSWDTAMKKNERADYSAMSSWGVFKAEDPTTGKTVNNIILLSAFKARLEFPELKHKVKQFYMEDQPDTLLIEDKGSGISLIQELRLMGVPVENFSYGRGTKGVSNDKVARANLVSDIFASGFVWAPERRFADELISEVAEFPNSEHDDLVDSTVQAMLRFRQGGFIRTQNDEDEEEHVPRRKRRYY
jgi:predicted phage terminase large subunit-like protein